MCYSMPQNKDAFLVKYQELCEDIRKTGDRSWQITAVLLGINIALLGYINSIYYQSINGFVDNSYLFLFRIFGLIISIFWFLFVLRLRTTHIYCDQEMKEIEKKLKIETKYYKKIKHLEFLKGIPLHLIFIGIIIFIWLYLILK